MLDVTMYSAQGCGYCEMAEQLLKRSGAVHLTKVLVDIEPGQLTQMIARTGRRTVPQIFIGREHVGGYTDLAALEKTGRLPERLAG